MYRPPSGATAPPTAEQPTWRNILAGFVLVAAVPAALWAASQPLTAAAAFAVAAAFAAAARYAHRLVRCFRECRGFAVDLGGAVRISVTPPPENDAA